MSDGLNGDPFHEGTAKPQIHTQGAMGPIHTTMPSEGVAQTNPRSAGADNVSQDWHSTVMAPKPAGTGANANPVH